MPDSGAKDDVLPGPPADVDSTDDRSGAPVGRVLRKPPITGTASGEPVNSSTVGEPVDPEAGRDPLDAADTEGARTPGVGGSECSADPMPDMAGTSDGDRNRAPSPEPPTPSRSFERCVRSPRCTPVTSGVQREDRTQRPNSAGGRESGGWSGLVAAFLQLDGDRGEGLALDVDAFGLQLGQGLLDVLVGLGRVRRMPW